MQERHQFYRESVRQQRALLFTERGPEGGTWFNIFVCKSGLTADQVQLDLCVYGTSFQLT